MVNSVVVGVNMQIRLVVIPETVGWRETDGGPGA